MTDSTNEFGRVQGHPAERETPAPSPKPSTANSASVEELDNASKVDHDTAAAVEFLRRWAPEGPWALTAIVPDGKTETRTFSFADVEKMRAWIENRQGEKNLYFSVNPVMRSITSKAKKTDIAKLVALHVDIDPRVGEDADAERTRILKMLEDFDPTPSVIIDSGGGYQGFWRLRPNERLEFNGDLNKAEELEAYNIQLEKLCKADACHNIDRIMRLPGTVNLPNKRKQEKGRKPALAKQVKFSEADYLLSDFSQSSSNRVREKKGDGVPPRGKDAPSVAQSICAKQLELTSLSQDEAEKVRAVIEHGLTDEYDFQGDRSAAVWFVCCALARAQVPMEQAFAVLINRKNRISAHIYKAAAPRDYAWRQVLRAYKAVGTVIHIRPGELPRLVEEAESALIAADSGIYQRGGQLVRIARIPRDTESHGTRRGKGALQVLRVHAQRLKLDMCSAATWEKHDGRSKRMLRCDAPNEVALSLLAQAGSWRFPLLTGLAETPTLRRDGSLLDVEGYDEESGLYVDFGDVEYPAVPAVPTKEECLAGLEMLEELIKDFPFVDEASRSVALSSILTSLCRRSMRSAPMHAFTAPTMSTGKSLLANVAAMIATGRSAPAMSQAKSAEEDEKRLFANLLKGDPIILIDNVERPIEGDAMCSILTEDVYASRILKESETRAVSTNALFLATGNNLTFKGDMTTRGLLCKLDSGVENPETRRFSVNLREEIPRRRAELVVAGLTVLRGFVAAGRPGIHQMTQFGRFEEWSDLVRGSLVWLGRADPVETRKAVIAEDPERGAHLELMEAWAEEFSTRYVLSAEVIERCRSKRDCRLARALEDALGKGSDSARSLGKYVSVRVGRIVGGLSFDRRSDKHNAGQHIRVQSGTPDDPRLALSNSREPDPF